MKWRRPLSLVGLGLVIIWTFLALLPPPVTFPHPYFASHPRWRQPGPQVIAHRGGWGLWPEHTIEGYRRALELGVDVLDIDVQLSADSTVVVLHDRSVDRTTEGQGRASSLTFEQLQQLDAGFDWTADGGASYPFRAQGLKIPSLQQVLAEFPQQHLVIELKTRDPAGVAQLSRQLCGLLQDAGHQQRAIIAAFSTDALQTFRRACPGVATSASSAEGIRYWVLHLLRLDVLAAPEFQALQVPPKLGFLTTVDQRLVEVSQNRGLPVQVWTIEDEDDMTRLIDLGVQGIFTPRPDRLLKLLQGHR